MREREFIQRQRVLAAKLSHPDILGVYELNIPLLWQAVVQLGCVATLRKQVGQRPALFVALCLNWQGAVRGDQSRGRIHNGSLALVLVIAGPRLLSDLYYPLSNCPPFVPPPPHTHTAHEIAQAWG